MEILRILIASYLVATLGATGMAKLVNRKTASVGMMREGALPANIALPAILAVAIVEISLAVLLAIGIYPEITAFGAAGLFVLFAGYRIIVGIKVKAVVCPCTGTVRADPASPPAVAGAVLACVCLAALACLVPFLGQPSGYPLSLISLCSLVLPVASMIAGLRVRSARKGLRPDARFPAHYVALGTEEMRLGAMR